MMPSSSQIKVGLLTCSGDLPGGRAFSIQGSKASRTFDVTILSYVFLLPSVVLLGCGQFSFHHEACELYFQEKACFEDVTKVVFVAA